MSAFRLVLLLVFAGLVASCAAAVRGSGAAPVPLHRPAAPTTTTPVAPAPTATVTPAAVAARVPRTPCTRNRRAQWVYVSLRRQHLWMCAGSHVVRDTAITSGMAGAYTSTPTGTFRIQGLNRNSILTLADGEQYPVKYWIPFQAPLFGFHDSPWQTIPYGSPQYRTGGSHGCVHMPLAAIRFLYRWAHIGTAVTIRG